MKLDVTFFSLKIDTGEKVTENLAASKLTAPCIQALPKVHKRKGSRKKGTKNHPMMKYLNQALTWIPSGVWYALFSSLIGFFSKPPSK